MTISRVLLAATVVAGIGSPVALLTPGSASASALIEGVYRFDYDGSKQTQDGKPFPTNSYSATVGIRSACPPAGCVATATDLNTYGWPQPAEASTFVYRETNDQWVMTRGFVYACNNGEMHEGGETQTFQVKPDGTFVGIGIKPRSPCPGGPLVMPFTATRVRDLPPDAPVADPNTV
ncbi:MAG: hypothetical protein QOH60_2512 [Mycobacterium sp.]|jgi:hypothetical protein|nr:hypothetical protein [Mycobacterium sp.]